MIGKFKLTRVNKDSGKKELIYSDKNQVTEGIKHSLVSILTGTGSKDAKDYRFNYFQLGGQKYDLSTYDISGDLTSSSFKSYFWTLKNPLSKAEYGYDSRMGVVNKPSYILGSVLPSGLGLTKVIDNFVEPPDSRTILNEYSNTLAVQQQGDPLNDSTYNSHLSSVWICGCADSYMLSPKNYRLNPLPVEVDYTMSGPDFSTPTWKFSYTTKRSLIESDGSNSFDSICVRSNHSYIYKGPVASHTQGEAMTTFTNLAKDQTISAYFAGKHYVSSVGGDAWPDTAASAFSGTNYSGKLRMFSRTLQALVGTAAGQNSIDFIYRYDFDNSAATYTPSAYAVSSGWQEQESQKGDALSQFSSLFGLSGEDQYGIVSGNVYNTYGAVYTYADHLNSYSSMNGPGADYMDTSNVGFGPSGNFYRVSLSWANAPDDMINYYKQTSATTYNGIILVENLRPCMSAVSGIQPAGAPHPSDPSGHLKPGSNPRQSGYIGFVQWDYSPSVGPAQNVHGEESYYLTSSQDFIKIPKDRTTYLNDNTTNVRLEVDEDLANSNTLREVGIFIKNPLGYGEDTPLLAAYKALPEDINKTNQFSYIVDWEFSFEDDSVS
tara:strand:+ start:19874 stop:21685 length:1812 start_codon:yes stop_codon:yes gene_type:complete